MLIPACGQLTRPQIPDLPGMDAFAGDAFHSAWWDHDVDLRGKRVAVVGTGASAIQFVPAIAGTARSISVFQRSAPWTLPKFDTGYRGIAQRLYERSPTVQHALRSAWRGSFESLAPVFTGRPPLRARASSAVATAISDLQRRVRFRHDPALRAATRPDYPIGCKRILITSDWYRALARPDVELVTSPIGELRAEGVVTGDGRLHEADVVIFGTGFTATQFLAPMEVTGRDGTSLRETWSAGAEAYYGMAVPRFPNMFVMYGPNTGHGTGSAIDMLEAQAGYVAQALGMLVGGGAQRFEVRQEVHDAFQRGARRAAELDGLGLGLRQLVRQRRRPRHRELARAAGRVPAPHRAARRGGLRDAGRAGARQRRLTAGSDGSRRYPQDRLVGDWRAWAGRGLAGSKPARADVDSAPARPCPPGGFALRPENHKEPWSCT